MIERGLLEAVLYDWENDATLERQNRDVALYLRLLARHRDGPQDVLELACGTGRVAIPLAEAGHRLAGVDLSPGRIELARAKSRPPSDAGRQAQRLEGPTVDWCIGDMREWRSAKRFDAVLVPYSSFLLLSSNEHRTQTLNTVREALNRSGFAVIDVSPNFPRKRETIRELTLTGPSELLRAHISYFETVVQHAGATEFQKEYCVAAEGEEPFTANFAERWHHLDVYVMSRLASDAGLAITETFGSYEETPLFDAQGRFAGDEYKHIYILRHDNTPNVSAASARR